MRSEGFVTKGIDVLNKHAIYELEAEPLVKHEFIPNFEDGIALLARCGDEGIVPLWVTGMFFSIYSLREFYRLKKYA